MQKINIAQGPENVTRLILGCMRMPSLSVEDAGYRRNYESYSSHRNGQSR